MDIHRLNPHNCHYQSRFDINFINTSIIIYCIQKVYLDRVIKIRYSSESESKSWPSESTPASPIELDKYLCYHLLHRHLYRFDDEHPHELRSSTRLSIGVLGQNHQSPIPSESESRSQPFESTPQFDSGH